MHGRRITGPGARGAPQCKAIGVNLQEWRLLSCCIWSIVCALVRTQVLLGPRTYWISNFQEILDQLLPIGSKHALRMELNPFYRQSSVAQAHDDIRAIPLMRAGADFQIAWYSLLRDNQRVIARGGHWCV